MNGVLLLLLLVTAVSGLVSVSLAQFSFASPNCDSGLVPETDSNGNLVTDPVTGEVSCVPY
jgi:hypothetical protein